MQVISLFSGIGGFELAARWVGWNNIVSCEINPFGQKVLKHHFPGSYHHGDIRTLTHETIKSKSRYNSETPTIVVGGFPCQPFSQAGKQKGSDDARYIWPEMLRVIREVKPEYIVAENVRGLLNIEGGLVFEQVCSSLENEGYEVQSFIIPACAVNAPHRRDRVWIVAHSNNSGCQQSNQKNENQPSKQSDSDSLQWTSPHSDSNRLQGGRDTERGQKAEGQTKQLCTPYTRAGFEDFTSKSPVCGNDDGLPRGLVGLTFSKWRTESIKALGNAIVPQIAFEIFKAIEATRTPEKATK